MAKPKPTPVAERACTKCGEVKAASEFNLNRTNGWPATDGTRRERLCKACRTANRRSPSSRAANRRIIRARRRQRPEQELCYAARRRAKARELEFNLTPDDIFIPDACPILGIPLVPGKGKSHDSSPTLDRINPDRGYVVGNVLVISHLANRLKSDARPWQLFRVAMFLTRFGCYDNNEEAAMIEWALSGVDARPDLPMPRQV